MQPSASAGSGGALGSSFAGGGSYNGTGGILDASVLDSFGTLSASFEGGGQLAASTSSNADEDASDNEFAVAGAFGYAFIIPFHAHVFYRKPKPIQN